MPLIAISEVRERINRPDLSMNEILRHNLLALSSFSHGPLSVYSGSCWTCLKCLGIVKSVLCCCHPDLGEATHQRIMPFIKINYDTYLE
jgi:hypothetical protein